MTKLIELDKQVINENYRSLAGGIIKQAIADATSKKESLKNEAWLWLLEYGFSFLTDYISIEISAADYLTLMGKVKSRFTESPETLEIDEVVK